MSIISWLDKVNIRLAKLRALREQTIEFKLVGRNTRHEGLIGWVGSAKDLSVLVKNLTSLRDEIVSEVENTINAKSLEYFERETIQKNDFLNVLAIHKKRLNDETNLSGVITDKKGIVRRFNSNEIDTILESISLEQIISFKIEIECNFRSIEPRFSSYTLIIVDISENSSTLTVTSSDDNELFYATKVKEFIKPRYPKMAWIRSIHFSFAMVAALSYASNELIRQLLSLVHPNINSVMQVISGFTGVIIGLLLQRFLEYFNRKFEVYLTGSKSTFNKILQRSSSFLIFAFPLLMGIIQWLNPVK